MTIHSLTISGFRSLSDVHWEPGALNVLIGPNGAGKSNLLRLLSLLRQAADGRLSDAVKESDGIQALLWDGRAKEIVIETQLAVPALGTNDESGKLHYELHLDAIGQTSAFRVEREWLAARSRAAKAGGQVFIDRTPGRAIMSGPNGQGRQGQPDLYAEGETLLGQVSDPANYPVQTAVKRLMAGFHIYHDLHLDQNAEMRRPALLSREEHVAADGANLVNVLHTLYSDDLEFRDDLNHAMKAAFGEDFVELVFPPAADNRIQLRVRWRSLKRPHTARDLSDGIMRFLFLIAVLGATKLPPLIAIDEPEVGLHPSMLPIVAEFAAQAAKQTQVIITTHSPQFLNAFSNQVNIATLVDWQQGRTLLRRPDAGYLARWLEHYQLGELWLSGELEHTQ